MIMARLTEDTIERMVEAMTDVIDARLMANTLSQVDYDKRMKEIADWADGQYTADRYLAPRAAQPQDKRADG